MSRIFRTTLVERRTIAEGSIEVVLHRPDKLDFHPGQYIQLGVHRLSHRDVTGHSRLLSIASSPQELDTISLAYRESESGFKRTLRELAIGAELLIEGPHGFHTLPETVTRPIAAVAGGIGIVPYLSMVRHLVRTGRSVPFTLLYANERRSRAAFLAELWESVHQVQNIALKLCTGPISDQHLRNLVADPLRSAWHVSGPPSMVNYVRNRLVLMGVDEARICYEDFVGY